MADKEEPEVATKAPESDAFEVVEPVAQGEVKETQEAQQAQEAQEAQPAMGEHCVSDRPTPSGASSSGEIIKLNDIDVYVSKPSDYPHAASKLLLLLSSGTGIHSTNNQLQADAFAKEGFLVIMPDQFNKDPAPNTSDVNAAKEAAGSSVLEQVKLHAAEAVQSFLIDMWLARQTPEKVVPILKKVIAAAKEEYADAYASGGGLYAVGYCFGGKYVLELGNGKKSSGGGQQDEEAAVPNEDGPFIKAGAFAHGTSITSQDFDDIKVPISIVAVENDQLFPDDHREAGVEKLQKDGIEHEVKVYPGVPHGFAVVGDYTDEKIQQTQADAFSQMLSWLQTH